jgi:acyl carrier protein
LAIIDDVTAIISKSLKIPVERLKPDARLVELGAESLDVIEIVFQLEEKFNISIPMNAEEGTRVSKPAKGNDDPAELQFSTIGDLATLVQRLVEKAP